MKLQKERENVMQSRRIVKTELDQMV